MNAVCVRCGGGRADFRQVCPSCGHVAEGEGLLVAWLLVAWLLSSENLDAEALRLAAERIAKGEAIRPSGKMLDKARRALGSHLASDPGLPAVHLVGLLLVHLLLTPLVGWVVFFWWRNDRPRAALQALALAVPSTVLFTALFVWLLTLPR